MIRSGEGAKVLQALGPDFAQARGAWERVAGFPLQDVKSLVVAFHDNKGNRPRVSVKVFSCNQNRRGAVAEMGKASRSSRQ